MAKNSSNSSRGKVILETPGKQISPAKHWVFTYNNYGEDTIKALKENSSIKRYIFQEECGSNGTKHLQGYVEFKDKCRPSSKFSSKKFHWEKCKRIKSSIEYCQKFETRIGKCYVKGIRKPVDIPIVELRDWQKTLEEKLNEEPNDRDINWIVDTVGNTGKTAFCKYWCMTHKNEALYVSGKAADMKYAIVEFMKNMNNDIKYVFIDLPRSIENFVSYQGIEEIKNGIFFSSKYESGMLLFNSPHVVCLSNFEPDYEKLSIDRWKMMILDR